MLEQPCHCYIWRDPGYHREKNIPITQPFLCVTTFLSCLWAASCLVNGLTPGSLIQDEDATQVWGARWGRATKSERACQAKLANWCPQKRPGTISKGEVRRVGLPGERHQESIWKSYCDLPRKISYFINFLNFVLVKGKEREHTIGVVFFFHPWVGFRLTWPVVLPTEPSHQTTLVPSYREFGAFDFIEDSGHRNSCLSGVLLLEKE